MLSAGSKVYVPQMHTDIFQTSSYIRIPEWYCLFTAEAEHIVFFLFIHLF